VVARSTPRAIAFGFAAAAGVALVYAVLSEPLELTLGLLAIAFFGGWLIGNGVAYGAWSNKQHDTYRPLRWTALALSVGAWLVALALAYTISQALIPQASTSLSTRLTLGGFFDYLAGLEIVPVIHVIALALMAFMAWRGAR
jgi:hypothetical protein